jgi:hypothetical protein
MATDDQKSVHDRSAKQGREFHTFMTAETDPDILFENNLGPGPTYEAKDVEVLRIDHFEVGKFLSLPTTDLTQLRSSLVTGSVYV